MNVSAPAFWQRRRGLACLLLPFAFIFAALAWCRRVAFRFGVLRAISAPVPVIVVGNIAVGGSGKTPVVAWLVKALRQAGWRPGIVSRGYGGSFAGTVEVPVEGTPDFYGDEPVLLARMTHCPVVVGRDRVAAVQMLLQSYPDCNVIVTDDGMQHYRLARDVEVAVVDPVTLGNRWRLPAGPLREPLARLKSVDVVIVHGSTCLPDEVAALPTYPMHLYGDHFYAMRGHAVSDIASWYGKRVHAIAGIGQPERFFNQLEAMGLEVVRHPFPDHHVFVAEDFDFAPGEPKVMTSKDAVKCRVFAPDNSWEFPVQAQIGPGAMDCILEKLKNGGSSAY